MVVADIEMNAFGADLGIEDRRRLGFELPKGAYATLVVKRVTEAV